MLAPNEYVEAESVFVFYCKLTDFPVPGFQWYPNTSSRFTVLLSSTSFSSSSWEDKVHITGSDMHWNAGTTSDTEEEISDLQQWWEVDESEVIIS